MSNAATDELSRMYSRMLREQARTRWQFYRAVAKSIDFKVTAQKDIAQAFGVARETVRKWAIEGRKDCP